MDWFRRWLRDNTDIIIDAPGYDSSQCWKPAQLNQLAMRKQNPSGMIIPRATTGNKKRIDPGKVPLEQKDIDVDAGSGVVVFIILGKYTVQACNLCSHLARPLLAAKFFQWP